MHLQRLRLSSVGKGKDEWAAIRLRQEQPSLRVAAAGAAAQLEVVSGKARCYNHAHRCGSTRSHPLQRQRKARDGAQPQAGWHSARWLQRQSETVATFSQLRRLLQWQQARLRQQQRAAASQGRVERVALRRQIGSVAARQRQGMARSALRISYNESCAGIHGAN